MQAYKTLQLATTPEVLMVQLKRFGSEGSKLDTLVQCPLTGLDLSHHMHQTGVSTTIPCMTICDRCSHVRVCIAQLHCVMSICVMTHHVVLHCIVSHCIMSYTEIWQLTAMLPGAPHAEGHVRTALVCHVNMQCRFRVVIDGRNRQACTC